MNQAAEVPVEEGIGFSPDPIMFRTSDMMGSVSLYPPQVEPKDWMQYPWKIVAEYGVDGPGSPEVRYIVKPEVYLWCFHHTVLIRDCHLWPVGP